MKTMISVLTLFAALTLTASAQAPPTRNPTDPNPTPRVASTFSVGPLAPDMMQSWSPADCLYDGIGQSIYTAYFNVLYDAYFAEGNVGCACLGSCYNPAFTPEASYFQTWNCAYSFVEAKGSDFMITKTDPNYNLGQPYPFGLVATGDAYVVDASGNEQEFFQSDTQTCSVINVPGKPFEYQC